ncbi:hypothetical protein F5883DRAFT_252650 [Diaporthe sp. PMI_573]|nr:hypothetical protein F5883DRAFT_252650 [Diaporthaceae sp. PMI_573]
MDSNEWVGIIPYEIREKVLQMNLVRDFTYYFREPDSSPGKSEQARRELAELIKVQGRAGQSYAQLRSESAWNHLVHTPVLDMVFGADILDRRSNRDDPGTVHVRYEPVISASIVGDSIPFLKAKIGQRSEPTGQNDVPINMVRSSGADVDYVLAIDCHEDSRLRKTIFDLVNREEDLLTHVNQTAYKPLSTQVKPPSIARSAATNRRSKYHSDRRAAVRPIPELSRDTRPTPSDPVECMPQRPDRSSERRQNSPARKGVDPRANPANTSAKRRTGQRQDIVSPRKRHETPGDTASERTCCLCDGALGTAARHQCCECPEIHFCVMCSVDASTFHPGHEFILVRPSGERGYGNNISVQGNHRHASAVSATAPVGPEEGGSEGEQEWRRLAPVESARPTSGNILEAAKYTVRMPQCSSCKLKLFDFRYECQECIGTHFCRGCHTLHSHHVLRRFTHTPDPRC